MIEDWKKKIPMKYIAVRGVKEIISTLEWAKKIKETNTMPPDMTEQERIDKIKKSTLVISEKDLGDDVQTEAQIKKFYPGTVKIVADEELFKIIDSTEP